MIGEYIISYESYLALVQVLGGHSKKEAKRIVDKMYFKEHGCTREEHVARIHEEYRIWAENNDPWRCIPYEA